MNEKQLVDDISNMRIPISNVLIGSFDTEGRGRYWKRINGHVAVRVYTERGKMWVILVGTDVRNTTFKPERQAVLVLLYDPDAFTGHRVDESGEELIATSYAYGIVVPLPPQDSVQVSDETENASMPTQLLINSSSESDERVSLSTYGESRIVVTDDMVLLRGADAEIAVGNDGIVTRGNNIRMNFFSESRGGIIKESWLGMVIPSSVVTPFPAYTIDTGMVDRIAGLAEAISSIRSV